MPQYLSVGEVSLVLGLSEKTIYRKQKEIPGFFKIAGIIRFDRQVLEDWIRSNASRPRVRPIADDRHGLT